MAKQRTFYPSVSAVAVVLLVVLTAVVCVWVVTRDVTSSATADDARAKRWLATHSPSIQEPSATVVVIGDSYAQGVGASRGRGWVDLLAAERGWVTENDARGGTGYLTSSTKGCGRDVCPNYSQMLDEVKAADPALVLVSGGRNDTVQRPAAEKKAVDAFYASVRSKFPDADIVAVSPIWDDDAPPAQLVRIRAIVKAAVENAGGAYVDIGNPLRGHRNMVISNGVHPNNAGHAAIYQAVEGALPNTE